MKLYTQYIFPWLLDKAMSKNSFGEKRKEVLSNAKGKILEIGLGTGLNLAEYPKHVTNITSVDVNSGMNKFVYKRAKISGKIIDHKVITAEKLPLGDESFDTVVSTWTLCSIPDVDKTLKEIYRVLRPDGKFIFIEHGLSNSKNIQKWQKRITPIWKKIGDGCHLDRNIKELVSKYFVIKDYKEFEMTKMSKLGRHMYQGIGVKK